MPMHASAFQRGLRSDLPTKLRSRGARAAHIATTEATREEFVFRPSDDISPFLRMCFFRMLLPQALWYGAISRRRGRPSSLLVVYVRFSWFLEGEWAVERPCSPRSSRRRKVAWTQMQDLAHVGPSQPRSEPALTSKGRACHTIDSGNAGIRRRASPPTGDPNRSLPRRPLDARGRRARIRPNPKVGSARPRP